MIANPLKQGDEIRVIAPSFYKSKGDNRQQLKRAEERLQSLGYKVTFGKYLESNFHLGTAKAEDRTEDFNNAYFDKNVKAILAYRGGWSANELLPLIDWSLVAKNPKPIIGFSDITILLNAIYAKTGNVGFLGPNFRTLGQNISWEYTLNNLEAVLKQETPLKLTRSKEWGVDKFERIKTSPWTIISKGIAEATLLGGNMGTFYLLQGTEYLPKFDKPFIFAIEDDDEAGKYTAREFSRRFESLLQQPNFRQNLKGLILGRFQPKSKVKKKELESMIVSKKLGEMPIVSGVDFGHTLPMLTLPIGRTISLVASDKVSLIV
ncbi:LD-carboxypeptidase [Candidatus Saccharibacteria bacterium]|nr:LD-carboxypeptidase [Candidatus Saccharibacteria bacterium]